MTDADTTTIPVEDETEPEVGQDFAIDQNLVAEMIDQERYVYLLHQQVAMLAARCSMLEAQVQTLAWQLKGASPQ